MTMEVYIPNEADKPFPHTALTKIVIEMVDYAKSLQISCQESFKVASSVWKKAKDLNKAIESRRKEAIDPSRKLIAQINDQAKELTDPLNEVEKIIKDKSAAYQKSLEEQRLLEIEATKDAAELLGVKEAIYTPPVAKSIRGEGAIAYTKAETKFRVVNEKLIPREYLKVDEEKVAAMIKLGISEIPGIEIYEEQKTILRSR
jgi:hypothetical protein